MSQYYFKRIKYNIVRRGEEWNQLDLNICITTCTASESLTPVEVGEEAAWEEKEGIGNLIPSLLARTVVFFVFIFSIFFSLF